LAFLLLDYGLEYKIGREDVESPDMPGCLVFKRIVTC